MKPIVCEVRRGGRIEAVHQVSAAVAEKDRIVFRRGETNLPVILRSSAKPFQALAVVESGAAEAVGLTAGELAVICGSHSGERIHVEAVRSILRKAGLTPAALRCGIHQPLSRRGLEELYGARKEPSVLHNNCSGKHAGMLAAARHVGLSVRDYLAPHHPIQRVNLSNLSRFSGVHEHRIPVAVDGCGAPTFVIPLEAMARAIAVFSSEGGGAAEIRKAMIRHPRMVGRFCADLMVAGRGRILAKGGAEGVYLLGIPRLGVGIALKVADGSSRPWPHVVEALLRRLSLLDSGTLVHVRRLADPVLRNHAGRAVGEIRVRV